MIKKTETREIPKNTLLCGETGQVIDGAVAPVQRDLGTLKVEILRHKESAEKSCYEMGLALLEVRSILAHGEFLPWVRDQIDVDARTAQLYMRLASEYANANSISYLGGFTRAKILLNLTPEERDEFVGEKEASGTPIRKISTRTLMKLVRERTGGPYNTKKKSKADYADFYEIVEDIREQIYGMLDYVTKIKDKEAHRELLHELYNLSDDLSSKVRECQSPTELRRQKGVDAYFA